MRAVIGLGNIGKRYEFTRHNAGFLLLDFFANQNRLLFSSSKQNYYYVAGELQNFPFVLAKPTTFMNLSGIAAVELTEKYVIDKNDLLVLCDDVHLDFGKLRIRQSGGDGGHNGIKSITYHLNSNLFPRLRIGIGKDFKDGMMTDYVLDKFNDDEIEQMKTSFKFWSNLIAEFIKGGTSLMLDYYSNAIKL
ncbi:MAG: aminoacyl-tRNA hydrolase [Ignavibacteriales bacterium]|nr:aminoacyl-tRNA hydrolase [Ignavibacteriales bacterium]